MSDADPPLADAIALSLCCDDPLCLQGVRIELLDALGGTVAVALLRPRTVPGMARMLIDLSDTLFERMAADAADPHAPGPMH